MMAHAYEHVGRWRESRRRAGAMLVALDFDGTLAPIVPHPDDAGLPEEARRALERLVARKDTRVAIVSGRGLADVRARVGLDRVYYAGNHGLEIEGPGVRRLHGAAAGSQAALRACMDGLRAELGGRSGVLIEDKGLTASVHYRMAPAARDAVEEAVASACGGRAGLRVTHGKMVVEVRPDVAWDKGRAVQFLVDELLADAPEAPVLFAGDDRTDEDAFHWLTGRGDGVIIADPVPAGTAARFHLRSPGELAVFVDALAADGGPA